MTNKTTQHGTRTESGTKTRRRRDLNIDMERDTERLCRHNERPGRRDQKQWRVLGEPGAAGLGALGHCSSCPMGAWQGSQLHGGAPRQDHRFCEHLAASTGGSPGKETIPWQGQLRGGAAPGGRGHLLRKTPGRALHLQLPANPLHQHMHSAALNVPHLL